MVAAIKDSYMTTREVMAATGMCRASALRMLKAGGVEYFGGNSKPRWLRADVVRTLESNTKRPVRGVLV